MQTMRVEINEMRHAFRVNGVTLAKRHLEKTIANGCNGDAQKMLYKFLVIVPFLAEVFEIPAQASESVRYGALKAKRIYEAIGLQPDEPHACVAFMMFCLEQSGIEPTIDGLRSFGPELARSFGARSQDVRSEPRSFQTGDRGNVVSFAEAQKNRTLH